MRSKCKKCKNMKRIDTTGLVTYVYCYKAQLLGETSDYLPKPKYCMFF